MGKCSICQQAGHNKTTCPQRPGGITEKVVTGLNTTQRKSNFSTTANPRVQTVGTANKAEIIPIPSNKPLLILTPKETSKAQKLPKIQTPPRVLDNVIYPALYSARIEAGNDREKVIRAKQVDLIKKLETIPIPKNPVIQTVSNFCNGCHNHGHLEDKCPSTQTSVIRNDRYDKKCGHCAQPGHNVKKCPELDEKRKKEKAEKESGPASWLNESAKARFKKPLTVSDGPGFIYMYTYLKPKSEADRGVFKIGMSKEEEGKRRIEVQEARNKEQYLVLYHEETPYRYLTENVIHLHLKDARDPRDQGDGKTEWFRGSQDHFFRVIKDVIKEVRFAIQNGFWDHSPVLNLQT